MENNSEEEFLAAIECIFENLQSPGLENVATGVFGQLLGALQVPLADREPTECGNSLMLPGNISSPDEIVQFVACAAKFVLASGQAETIGATLSAILGGDAAPDSRTPMQVIAPCAEKSVHASAIRTREDIVAFVNCAYEYMVERGTAEAARAFHEDVRWRSGQFYMFVFQLDPSAGFARIVHPPNPEGEGVPWGPLVDLFGSDLLTEFHRVLGSAGSGWVYYSFLNPQTGLVEPKATYTIEVDWDGKRAALGAGIYEPGIPGACHTERVNARALAADPTDVNLEAFVRCAARLLSEQGYFASPTLSSASRWRSGPIYVFGLDPRTGAQHFSGNPIRVNGVPIPELADSGDATGQFGGRDMLGVATAFGDTYLTYQAVNPVTGLVQTKVSYVKSLSVQGVPFLVGAGRYLDSPSQ